VLKGKDSERGQVIVLFVIVFSIFLMLAAFAIDQGYWYGRRRVVQKDADLPARAGALEYIGNIGDLSGAATSAEQAARDNGVTGTINAFGSETCAGTGPNGSPVTIDAPSVTVELTTNARRFLSGLPLISDDSGPVEVGARAVACVGSLTRLYVANGDDPDVHDNTLKGIQIALRQEAGGPRSCFSGDLVLGEECVIYGSKAPPSPGNGVLQAWDKRRMAFTNPQSDECRGGASILNAIDDIDDGLPFTCTVNTTGTCGGSQLLRSCVRTEEINNDENQERVLRAMEERLDANTNCASLEGSGSAQSFQNAFGNGDGDPSLAPAPPDLGGTAASSHVYVQNDCYDNPRIVVIPIMRSSSGDTDNGLNDRPVVGLATVYVTGCFLTGDPGSEQARQSNECNADDCDFPGDGLQGDCLNVCPGTSCSVCSNTSLLRSCHVEIRAIPIHMFITEGSIGGIAAPTNNAPLTIQTVQ
jgi:hypothetical protein